MAALILYPRFDLGTLASTSPGAEATTATGWTVGTNTPTKHKLMDKGVERSASSWSEAALPSANPDMGTSVTDTLVSADAFTGKFAAEAWALTLKAIAVTSGGDQDGAARVRLWRTANKISFTALTAAADLSTVTNLAVGAAQTTSGLLSPGAFELANEYLALQIAWKITGAGGAATRDVLFREGEGITLVTADFTGEGEGATGPRPGSLNLLGVGR